MSDARIVQLAELNTFGSQYIATDVDTDIDIAGPKQYSITTPAKRVQMTIRVNALAAATVALNTGVAIGTGGSAAAGTAVASKARDQAFTTAAGTVIKADYVLGSSGQSAGTAIWTEYQVPNLASEIKFTLKPSTVYGLIITSIADNNIASVQFEFSEF
jgi:hypothetical protein